VHRPFGAALLLGTVAASAADYPQTIAMFANTAQSATFFDNSFGYAVFPAVGRGSFIVGAAHGMAASSRTHSNREI
jgi:hypothetical protein